MSFFCPCYRQEPIEVKLRSGKKFRKDHAEQGNTDEETGKFNYLTLNLSTVSYLGFLGLFFAFLLYYKSLTSSQIKGLIMWCVYTLHQMFATIFDLCNFDWVHLIRPLKLSIAVASNKEYSCTWHCGCLSDFFSVLSHIAMMSFIDLGKGF